MTEIFQTTDPISGMPQDLFLGTVHDKNEDTNFMTELLHSEILARDTLQAFSQRYMTTRELGKIVAQIELSQLKVDILPVLKSNKKYENMLLNILQSKGFIDKNKIQNHVHIYLTGSLSSPILEDIETPLKHLFASHTYYQYELEKFKDIPFDQNIKLVISVDRDEEGFFIKNMSFETY